MYTRRFESYWFLPQAFLHTPHYIHTTFRKLLIPSSGVHSYTTLYTQDVSKVTDSFLRCSFIHHTTYTRRFESYWFLPQVFVHTPHYINTTFRKLLIPSSGVHSYTTLHKHDVSKVTDSFLRCSFVHHTTYTTFRKLLIPSSGVHSYTTLHKNDVSKVTDSFLRCSFIHHTTYTRRFES